MTTEDIHRALSALHAVLAEPSRLWPDDIATLRQSVSILEGLVRAADRRRG